MDVREKLVEQKIKGDGESICYKCFHNKVCKAMDNQPCIECNQFVDAHGVTVQELDGCQHCMGVSYTDNPFTVITQMGREVKTQFNFCPNCGRRLPQPPKGE